VQPGACEGDESFEVLFELFVAGGEAAEVFEPGEASLDAVSFSIEFFVVSALLFAIGLGRYYGNRSHRLDVIEDGLTVVAFVGQHPFCLSRPKQFHGLSAVIDLAACDEKIHRQAQFVGQQMNLGRQTSSGAPQSLVRAPFLRPVAAC
jgi:hypothetical protein